MVVVVRRLSFVDCCLIHCCCCCLLCACTLLFTVVRCVSLVGVRWRCSLVVVRCVLDEVARICPLCGACCCLVRCGV